MARKRNQITCQCGLYAFPHRQTRLCVWFIKEQIREAYEMDQTIELDRRERARDMNESNKRYY